MIQELAEVLEVSVQELLGGERQEEMKRNQVVEQLARMNEQLAIRNRRSERIWKGIGSGAVVLLMILLLYVSLQKGQKPVEDGKAKLPDIITISKGVTMSNNEEFHCEFVPSVGDKDLFYKVTVSGENEAKECEVSFENGICIASCEKLYPYLPYQIVLSISDGVKERNVTIVTDLTVDENGGISYTSEWQ